jgi:hypothetical protein
MHRPGYVYLLKRETADGVWVKVGIAARIGRVLEHRGWDMLIPTFETDVVLEDPCSLEQRVLKQFPDTGKRSNKCGMCGALKPPVGRMGSDGLTEVRHLRCYPSLPDFFAQAWKLAPRLARDAAWRVDFDPLSLRPGGFVPVGEWRQPPRMDASEYTNNTCNVLCVRGVPAREVLVFLDSAWERGTVHLRKALSDKFGVCVCKADGTPTPRAKGTGVGGHRSDVEDLLTKMTRLPDVEVVLVSVRKPGILYAYAPDDPVQNS